VSTTFVFSLFSFYAKRRELLMEPLQSTFSPASFGVMTRSATLASTPAFPTRGYCSRLLDEISSPDAEGFSSFHILLLTMSPLIPRRREPPHRTRFDRLLLLSHAIDRLSLRIFV
jgi:hypothetical protein